MGKDRAASKTASKASSGIQKPLIPSAWGPTEDHTIPGDIPGAPSAGPSPGEYQKADADCKPVFRTSAWNQSDPRPDWANPYSDPPRYSYYDANAATGGAKEKKWEPDAKFFHTRHPVGCSPPPAGASSPLTKGAVHYKTWGALTLSTATSWLENEQGLVTTLERTAEIAEKVDAGDLPLEEEEPVLSSEHSSEASEAEEPTPSAQ